MADAGATAAEEALVMADALQFLAPPKPRGGRGSFTARAASPGASSPASRRSGYRDDFHALNLLDKLSKLDRHPCVRYIAASSRLLSEVRPRSTATYQYDTAIADRAKLWARDDNNRRRDIAEELAACTFQPEISAESRKMPRRKVGDFHQSGLEWIKNRERKLQRTRDKEAAERREEEEAEERPWQLSDASRQAAIDRQRRLRIAGGEPLSDDDEHEEEEEEEEEDATGGEEGQPRALAATPRRTRREYHEHQGQVVHTAPRRTYRSQPYTDERTWRPSLTPHETQKKRAATPVVDRLMTRGMPNRHAAPDVPDDGPQTLVMDDDALVEVVARLHVPRKKPVCPQQRSGMDECTFSPRIREAPPSVLPGSEAGLVRPRRGQPHHTDFDYLDDTVRLCPEPGVMFPDDANRFFARQEQWRRDVQERRVQLRQQKEDREVNCKPFSPRITHLAISAGRAWGVDDDSMEVQRTTSTRATRSPYNSAGTPTPSKTPRRVVASFRPAATRTLPDQSTSAADAPARDGTLRRLFVGLDTASMGFIRSDAAVAALQDYVVRRGSQPAPVDVDELPSRVSYADFVGLLQRMLATDDGDDSTDHL